MDILFLAVFVIYFCY